MPDQTEGGYVPRLLEVRLQELFRRLPAILLVGPRAAGKTTTARRYAATTVRLDREAEAAAFRADPDAALRAVGEPVLLDEWQAAPEVLGAVKRSVDADPRPGRFLVTGSVRAELQQATWPGTGRLVRLALFGLTVREQDGVAGPGIVPLLDRIAQEGLAAVLDAVDDPPDLPGYLELLLRSGFPEPALRLDPVGRDAWFESYLDHLLTRDVELIHESRDPDRLRGYLVAFAANTARVVDDKTLWEAAGINRRTAIAYEQLLANLFVVERLPAWSTNVLKQLVRAPKRHVLDPALAAAALNLGVDEIIRRGELLGPLLDSFVTAQVRAEAAASPLRPRLFHVRTRGGRSEVDLIADLGGNRLVGIEVKASAAPRERDARPLLWLRDAVGEDFVAGLVLHTGPRSYRLAPRVAALPIAALWA